jgi:ABC-type antimicrobial peptide transport system permease subunit
MILRQGMTLAGLGIAIGLVGALGVTRVMRALLYGISPTDPLTFAAAVPVLAAAALLACWIPARRAMRVDPIVALRSD